MTPFEQAFGDTGNENLPFNRKKPSAFEGKETGQKTKSGREKEIYDN